jgi:translation initiation factor 5B
LNVALLWEKVDFSEYVPLVPTSAITGDGMGDLIALLVEYSTRNLVDALMLSMEIEAIVMEVDMSGVLALLFEFPPDRSKLFLG